QRRPAAAGGAITAKGRAPAGGPGRPRRARGTRTSPRTGSNRDGGGPAMPAEETERGQEAELRAAGHGGRLGLPNRDVVAAKVSQGRLRRLFSQARRTATSPATMRMIPTTSRVGRGAPYARRADTAATPSAHRTSPTHRVFIPRTPRSQGVAREAACAQGGRA